MKMNQADDTTIADAAHAFAALGSERRLSVLRALVRAGPEGLSIGELGEATGITGATLTHHVRFLAQAGLLVQEKKGRSVICAAVSYETVRHLSHFLLSECCADAKQTSLGHDHETGDRT